jgi:rare lipoprotein A
MSTLAGNAARLLAACLSMLCVNGAARASSCVSASWYHEGSRTATGERYRPDGLTAAHRTLRMGARVRVTNRRNGRSVVVRINDRGPAAWTGRSIDLSRGAARALGMLNSGVAPVCFQVVGGGGHRSRHAKAGGRVHRRHAHRLERTAARRMSRHISRRLSRRAPKSHTVRQARRDDDT